MSPLKLPGKHRNNTTKSNRKERERPNLKKDKVGSKSPFLKRLEDFLAVCVNGPRYRHHINSYVLQIELGFTENDARKWLKKLEKIGYIEVVSFRRTLKNKLEPNYYITYKPEDLLAGSVLQQKFGGHNIRVENMKQLKSQAFFTGNNFLKNFYNREVNILRCYGNYAESWNNLTEEKRASLMIRQIMSSYIICCHFIDVCTTLTPKERQKIISKICSSPDAAMYTLFNSKLSKIERRKLVAAAKEKDSNWIQLVNNLTDKVEREIVIKEAFKNLKNLESVVSSLRDYLDNDDKDYLALKIAENGTPYLAHKVATYVKFNEEQQDLIAHLVLAYRMTNDRW